jgi:HSP20 family protein
MFGTTRWNPFEEMFTFQREADRLFDNVWRALPTRTTGAWAPSFQVSSNEEGWLIDVPLPGIDPQRITLEVAGNTLTVRAEQPAEQGGRSGRYEQTITVPQFVDLDKLRASHHHGMLQLTLPLRESVRPRRIQIETAAGEPQKQLTAVA